MSTTIVLADDHTVVRQGIRKLLETRDDFRIVGEASGSLRNTSLEQLFGQQVFDSEAAHRAVVNSVE